MFTHAIVDVIHWSLLQKVACDMTLFGWATNLLRVSRVALRYFRLLSKYTHSTNSTNTNRLFLLFSGSWSVMRWLSTVP